MNTLLASLAGTLALIALTFAGQTPKPTAADPEPVSVIHTAPVARIKARPKPQPPCTDPLAAALWQAGFRGQEVAMMWAIAMRESRAKNIGPGSPEFNGEDYGIFQLNRPTWGHEAWWNDKDILTVHGSARMAYALVQEHGFQPWALTASGKFDFSSYDGWSDWQRENWIVRPYLQFLARYWETCNGWDRQS